jgi:hypothetical protein
MSPRRPDLGVLAICAIRYALGRRSYMPGLICRIVEGLALDGRDIGVILRDIDEAKARDRLGDDCDRREWLALRRVLDERSGNSPGSSESSP